MSAGAVRVRPVAGADRPWLAGAAVAHWGSDRVVSRGRLIEPLSALPGLIAELDGERTGYALLRPEGDEVELVALASTVRGAGIGSALLRAVDEEAAALGSRRLWLVTTNDNVAALRFYQRRGWRLAALRPGAVLESRRLKPEIPATGEHGIPIRDELELERVYSQPR